MRRSLSLLLCLILVLGLAACGQTAPTETAAPTETPAHSPAVADASQMTTVEEVVEAGMTPVYPDSLIDGDWPVQVKSSSSMFRIESAVLHVEGGAMTATLTLSGKSYLYLFPGTALEADAAGEGGRIPFTEDEGGAYTYTLPVEALDAPIPCAAFSKNKQLWYDRMLLFRADSLPTEAFREGFFVTAESLGLADGEYSVAVTLSGGSGKASVESPARLTVKDGVCTARIVFSSKNYDYVRIDDAVYLPVNAEGNSSFELPVAFFDRPMPIVADTVAMSEPHEIAYTLTFDSAALKTPDAAQTQRMELAYAERFTMDLLPDGGALVTLGEKERFLLLDRDTPIPAGYEDIPVIYTPVERVYLASSSVPDFIVQLDALDRMRFTATKRESWRLPEVCEALDAGTLLYAGKYSAPDYELLLEEGCDLAVENTMILHSPETREMLEALGLPVLIEYSSYEPHPLGRVEWIKLYGLLTGKLAEAEAFFDRQLTRFAEITENADSGKTVAFFHITANGSVTVRRQADYVTRMIELAGGKSAFTDLPEDDNALSTVTIQMESFYTQARDADVLIYNSTASVDVQSVEELLSLCPLLEDFKAVREGQVWCNEKSMFQRSSAAADVIADFHEILQDAPREDTLNYLHRIV